MRSLVAYICHVNVEIAGELVFDGQVPLLRVGEMPFVELPVNAGIFPVVIRQVEERGRLILCARKTFAEERRGRDTAVARTENNAGVKPVASARYAGVPSRITQRLKEDSIPPSNHGLGVQGIRYSEARCEIVHISSFRIRLPESGRVAAPRNVSREDERA